MKLLVTGATGFLGQHVVRSALAQGFEVRALARPKATLGEWANHPACEIFRGDLRSVRTLAGIADGVDAILHLAATVTGDFYDQFEGAVLSTENLLSVLPRAESPCRIVLVSSFSVYGYRQRDDFSALDESTPVDDRILRRDDYAYVKLWQENMVREFAVEKGHPIVVLRPGWIYGPGKLMGARLGAPMSGRWWLRVGARAQVPATYVENCADAVVRAADQPAAVGKTFNIVDDSPPTQRYFLDAVLERSERKPRVVPMPWTVMRAVAWVAAATNTWFLRGRAKLPGLFIPERLHARFKPLTYDNRQARQVLGWVPRFNLEDALDRCLNGRG